MVTASVSQGDILRLEKGQFLTTIPIPTCKF